MQKFWQAFFDFFSEGLYQGNPTCRSENSSTTERRNPLSMRAEGDNPVTIACRQYGVEIKSSAYLFPGVAWVTSSGSSRYFFSRTALNVPSFDGPSPTSGENSASPVIKSAVSNFPLHVNVPASRPTLPIRNSTGPENVTEFPSSRVHFASEGLASPQTLDCASVTVRVPFLSLCASKRRKRCCSLAKVTSTFQLPVTFEDSASAKTKENVFTTTARIIARAAFTFFSGGDLSLGQGAFFGTAGGAYSVLA